MQAEAIYEALPARLQHVAVSGYGYVRRWKRLAGPFREYRRGFAERDRLTAEQWDAWQEQSLRRLLALAWEVPHYRDSLGAGGLAPGDVGQLRLDDLRRLPVLTKEHVRRDPDALCPGGARPRGAGSYPTSGSTGTPLMIYATNNDLRRQFAVRDARYTSFAGVGYSLPRATFSGRRVAPEGDTRGPFHRYNVAEHQVYFSPYHLGPGTVADYVEAMWRHPSRWITGYAGSIHELARLALDQGLQLPPLDAAITAAEPASDRLRRDVAEGFGCRVSEEYGLIEQVAFALECEHGRLHVSPDVGRVEILDEDDRPCPPGEVGEIVGTGFVRMAQPFIRYRTGDLASWDDHPACECGREMPVLSSIEGRVDDVVIAPDGRRVGRLSTVPKELDGVIAMQFVQEERDLIRARVVCDGELLGRVEDELRERLRDRLGVAMRVEVEKVSELERTGRGKTRGVIRREGVTNG